MLRRRFIMILTCVITLSVLCALSVSAITYHNAYEYDASYFPNFDDYGVSLRDSRGKSASVGFTQVILDNDRIELVGSVGVGGDISPFHFVGKLVSDPISCGTIIGTMLDRTDQFEIVYFALDRAPFGKPLLNPSAIERDDFKVLMQLYLIRRDTRDFIALEVVNPAFHAFAGLQKAPPVMGQASIDDRNWFARTFKPILVEDTISEPLHSDLVSRTSSSQTQRHHALVYDVFGGLVQENIWVDFWVEGEAVRPTAEFRTTLRINYKNTRSVAWPAMNAEDNSLRIGLWEDTRVDVATDTGDAVAKLEWASNTTSAGGWITAYGVNLVPSSSPIGVTLSYVHGAQFDLQGYFVNFQNVFPGSIRRQAGVRINKSRQLTVAVNPNIGQHHRLDANFIIRNYDGVNRTKSLQVEWRYYLSSSINAYFGGYMFQPLTVNYASSSN